MTSVENIGMLKGVTMVISLGISWKQLKYGGLQKMFSLGADKTVYLNVAIVRRVKRLIASQETVNKRNMNNKTSRATADSRGTMRAFTLVEIIDGRLDEITERWGCWCGRYFRITGRAYIV